MFQKVTLVAEVLVWAISNYGDVSLLQNTAFTFLLLARKLCPLNWPDWCQKVVLGKKGPLRWNQGLR